MDYNSDEKAPTYDVADNDIGIVLENVDDLKDDCQGGKCR
jgi:hypothetical protein